MVLWLDLANAYGSMPHKLVLETLERHHVPDVVRDLIMDYYSDFSLRTSAGAITSDWHRLEVGIITGCTTSVILFALAMNMLVKSAEPKCRGPKSKYGIRQLPILHGQSDSDHRVSARKQVDFGRVGEGDGMSQDGV